MRKILLTIALLSLLLIGCNNREKRYFWSPYNDINWEQVDYCDAEFHTHPGLGDEQYDPHQTVDRYKEEGYKILVLAGHDYHIPTEHIGSIYPWTQLEAIYEKIKDVQNLAEDNRTYGEIANEPYQNRDPVELGMISIEGCEVSGPHHIVSLFNSCTQGAETEEETFNIISDLGGLAYFAHPGRYVERRGLTADWYANFYEKYEMLLGQSVYNSEDNYPTDRSFFDEIAHKLGYKRPIWLFGEDDMHRENTLGWNRNVILIENFQPGSLHPDIQDGSVPDVKDALKNGRFYLWKPSEKYNKRSFNISNIKTKRNRIELQVDNRKIVNSVRWVTFDPDQQLSVIFHEGYDIDINIVPEFAKFVRAEIEGEGGTIYTQPFYIIQES